MTEKIYQPETLPVLALRNLVIFPEQTISFEVGRLKSIRSIKAAVDTESRRIFLVSQKDALIEEPKFQDLSDVGVVAVINQISGTTDSKNFEIVVEGLYRARVTEVSRERISLRATVQRVPEIYPDKNDPRTEAMLRILKDRFDRYLSVSPRIAPEIFLSILENKNLAEVYFLFSSSVNFTISILSISDG